MQASNCPDSTIDIVCAFLDALIVGNLRWPCASRAIGNVSAFVDELSGDDRSWLLARAARLAPAERPEVAQALHAIEHEDPERFQRFLNVLYGSYYTSAAAAACLRDLAIAGPQGPLHFDPALLCNVMERQAGKRRL